MKFLSSRELQELTGKSHSSSQARALNEMGIDFRKRPDGKVIVVDADLPLRNRAPTHNTDEAFVFGS